MQIEVLLYDGYKGYSETLMNRALDVTDVQHQLLSDRAVNLVRPINLIAR